MLGLLYVFAFFVLYIMLWMGPELLDLLGSTPPGPDQQKLAEELVQESLGRAELLIALIASLATVALGARFQFLPGLKT